MIPGQELEIDNIVRFRSNAVGGEGQPAVLGDLYSDVVGRDASSETQENGKDGSETHVSDKKRRMRVAVSRGTTYL